MTRHEIPPEDSARAAEWLLAEYDATDIEELADSIGAVQAHRTICVLKTLLDGGSPCGSPPRITTIQTGGGCDG
jgi:hypothetical protein